jgi:glycosyltransferase involved in cell wall biosynthesis
MIDAEKRVGFVVIGKNEGGKLKRCLQSIPPKSTIVYVDSGSIDGSVEFARSLDVKVIALDMTLAFTAARARNAGFNFLETYFQEIEYIQFLDGDCELLSPWVKEAVVYLDANNAAAVVCGHLTERHPEASVYNRLVQFEWNTPVGNGTFCGGNSMMRRSAFKSVGGFSIALAAGEEPELCIRYLSAKFSIAKIDVDMAIHDAEILHFSQWWKRVKRGGYAFANGAWLHGSSRYKHWRKETRSALIWGFLMPLTLLIIATIHPFLGLLLLCIFPIQILRLSGISGRKPNMSFSRAFFTVLGKFPEALGVLKFYWGLVKKSLDFGHR